MKRFTNEKFLKQSKKISKSLWWWAICLLAAFALVLWGYEASTKESDIEPLNDIIISNASDKTNKEAYIDVEDIPYLFAEYDNRSEKYYIVLDDQYMYIAFMGLSDFSKLNHESIYENPIRVTGVTKGITKDVRDLALEYYNETRENEEDKLGVADFENYFGDVYLDMTVVPSKSGDTQYAFAAIFGVIAIIGFLISGIYIFVYHHKIKKLDDETAKRLDDAMNDKNSFFYERANLFLTPNYIIQIAGGLSYIDYQDMIWVYRYELRQNGIKTQQSIRVMTKDGKIHNICNVDALTKKSNAVYDEILETIASKKENLIIGYSKEARNEVKEKYGFRA